MVAKKQEYTAVLDFHPIDVLFAQRLLPNAPENASFFLSYLLKAAREGHLCICLESEKNDKLIEGAALIPSNLFEKQLVREGSRIYLRRNWECENRFITHLKRLKCQSPKIKLAPEWIQKRLQHATLNLEQKDAIFKVCENTFSLITGGPGTGKTYTAAAIVAIFLEIGVRDIMIAAPTGKATANMRSALGALSEGCTFKTVHALLQRNKLNADLVIVDEASMIDSERMAGLFSAIKDNARLVLLGDRYQLPPIESGHLFADLTRISHPFSELKDCLRTDLREILDLAESVKMGLPIPSLPLPEVKILSQMLIQTTTQVLTPLKKGPYGVDHLNELLYRERQKNGKNQIPIMITKNAPYDDLFNGDVGILEEEKNVAHFSNGRSFPEYLLPSYEFAYVISVHKSQGSEYDHVMILLPQGSEIFGREMLYTALTRAKKKVTILAHEGVIEQLVQTPTRRFSGVFS